MVDAQKINISVIIAVVVNIIAMAWWASKIEARVQFIEQTLASRADVVDRLTRIEVSMDSQFKVMERDLDRIEGKLNGKQ